MEKEIIIPGAIQLNIRQLLVDAVKSEFGSLTTAEIVVRGGFRGRRIRLTLSVEGQENFAYTVGIGGGEGFMIAVYMTPEQDKSIIRIRTVETDFVREPVARIVDRVERSILGIMRPLEQKFNEQDNMMAAGRVPLPASLRLIYYIRYSTLSNPFLEIQYVIRRLIENVGLYVVEAINRHQDTLIRLVINEGVLTGAYIKMPGSEMVGHGAFTMMPPTGEYEIKVYSWRSDRMIIRAPVGIGDGDLLLSHVSVPLYGWHGINSYLVKRVLVNPAEKYTDDVYRSATVIAVVDEYPLTDGIKAAVRPTVQVYASPHVAGLVYHLTGVEPKVLPFKDGETGEFRYMPGATLSHTLIFQDGTVFTGSTLAFIPVPGWRLYTTGKGDKALAYSLAAWVASRVSRDKFESWVKRVLEYRPRKLLPYSGPVIFGYDTIEDILMKTLEILEAEV